MNKKILALLSIVVILILLCVSAWFFLRRSTADNLFVQIQNPEQGMLAGLNDPIPLVVAADGNRTIQRLEVYADGTLIAAANGTGQNTLSLSQNWVPTTTGRHAVVARAFFDSKSYGDSNLVFVDVADFSETPVRLNVDNLPRGEGIIDVTVQDIANAAGTTPERLAQLNPGLPSTPESLVPAGTVISFPPRPSAAPLEMPVIPPPLPGGPGTSPDAPPASQFQSETHTCTEITLRWNDAPDETEYSLYRVAPDEDVMSELARVSANTITYTDTSATRAGTYRYMLAPARPNGTGISSMIAVTLGQECQPAASTGSTNLKLLMMNLTTQEPFTGIYCYISVNGSRYERIPSDPGLLLPTNGTLSYDLPLQLPTRGQYPLTAASGESVRLNGECWGRSGAESVRIGQFSSAHASSEWDGRDLTASMSSASGGSSSLRYKILPQERQFDLSNIAPGALNSVYLDIPLVLDPLSNSSPAIPAPVNVALEYGWGCDPLLFLYSEGGYQCFLSVPSIAWSWNPSPTVTRDNVTGFVVKMEFAQPGVSRRIPGPQFTTPNGTARGIPARVLPTAYRCGTTVYITVTARTTQGPSAPSAPLVIRQPECSKNKLRVRITNIELASSRQTRQFRDDGDICVLCDDRRLEVYGSVYVNGFGEALNSLGHGADAILFGSCPASNICLTEGNYSFAGNTRRIPWLFEIDVSNVGRVILTVFLYDYDTQNGPDPLCAGSGEIEIGSLVSTSFQQILTVGNDFGEASCRVNAEVRIAP